MEMFVAMLIIMYLLIIITISLIFAASFKSTRKNRKISEDIRRIKEQIKDG